MATITNTHQFRTFNLPQVVVTEAEAEGLVQRKVLTEKEAIEAVEAGAWGPWTLNRSRDATDEPREGERSSVTCSPTQLKVLQYRFGNSLAGACKLGLQIAR